MEDGAAPSRYVKLKKKKKKQRPVEEIKPDELNQPIEVPQMAEGAGPSRYVKLKKEQMAVEEIKPDELNHPIEVPQLAVKFCNDCGQPWPPYVEPLPGDPWTTGIFDCAEDRESCLRGLFCPCVLFGQNYANINEEYTSWTGPCVSHAVCIEGGMTLAAVTALFHGFDLGTAFCICNGLFYGWLICAHHTGSVREALQKDYQLENTPWGWDSCVVHMFFHWCAICQEHREVKSRHSVMPMTVVNPPPVQQMMSSDENRTSVQVNREATDLELQAL